jgi:signal transduction histidine kinase
MLIFILLHTFLFGNSFEYNFNEESLLKKINYFNVCGDTLVTIQDNFIENKIIIEKLIGNEKSYNFINNFEVIEYYTEYRKLILKKYNQIVIYDEENGKFKYLFNLDENFEIKKTNLIIDKSDDIYLQINDDLYLNDSLIYNNCIDIKVLQNEIYILLFNQNDVQLISNGVTLNRFEYFDKCNIKIYNSDLFIVNNYNDRLLIKKLNSQFEIIEEYWLNTNLNKIHIGNYIYFYDLLESNFYFINGEKKELFKFKEKFDFFNIYEDKFVIQQGNIIKLVNKSGKLVGIYDNTNQIDKLIIIRDKFYLLSNGNLNILSLDKNNYWYLNFIFVDNLYIILIVILLLVIFRLFFKYRQKQIIFYTIFDLPSTGLIIHLNDKGEILNLNKHSRQLFSIPDSVKLGEYFKKYYSNDNFGELTYLINKALHLRTSFKEKINVKVDNNLVEIMCNIISIQNFAGLFRGILITGTDITEELENKRLSNWAQLAHDMQTNLSTIKLNIEQLESVNEKDLIRKEKIIHQSNLLIKRVRDIVTVGRSNQLNKLSYSTEEVYNGIVSEFDFNNFPDIEIVKDVEKFNFIADKDKIIRGVRNALENAIKIFDGKKGVISIIIKRDNRFVYLIVKDNGIGMDKETLLRMKDPYFTTKSSKGGSGIGTIIMQKVTEQHGGELIINSQKNKGTEVIFKIPYLRN